MASDGANSILQSLNTRYLKEFSWNLLVDELSKFAPLLMSLLFSAIKRHKVPHTDTDCAIVGLCASMS